MNWYNGDIGAAINESKTKKLIFLVHSIDANSQIEEYWNKEEITKLCNENCVCLKLEADTQTFNQFKQIYPVTVQPTTYLIGNNGLPLEVITGQADETDLIAKLVKAIETNKLSHEVGSTAAGASTATTSSAVTTDAAESDAAAAAAADSENDGKSLEEKVALAKEKIRLIQEKKRLEQEEKDRNSELERRKMGQEVLKMKREKDEDEIKKLAEEKRREKMQDEQAKRRVLEQIKLDREEKQKKYSKEREEAEKVEAERKAKLEVQKQQEKQAEAARNSNAARLQFRFVDGSTLVSAFTPEQTLDEVRQFVAQKLKEMNETAPFAMHSSYPKREYTQADMTSTLRELQLAPSASLLVIPKLK